MADVYQNWTLYNVGKAIKNGVEYPFDWTMLSEYQTLQQQYSDYQANIDDIQADLKTSIESKGVTVPSSATLDQYPSYIDQINVRSSWMSHLVTPTKTFSSYYNPYSQFTPISWEYNWIAYWVGNYHYYTGSDSFRDYEGIIVCKITPTTWIAWATMYTTDTQSDHKQNRTDTPVAWNVWRNADSSSVKVFIFLDQYPSSSYPQLNAEYCFAYTRDTNWSSGWHPITNYSEVAGTRGDYNPTNYWYDLTWYTQVTGSSWISTLNMSKSSTTVSYSFNIKD